MGVKLLSQDGEEITTTWESLRFPETPYIGWIPISVPDFLKTSGLLTTQKLANIAKSCVFSQLQQEFLVLHHHLNHISSASMLCLEKYGILPWRFLKLKNDTPPCVSCHLGKAHENPWRSKTSTSGKLSTI